MMVQPNQDEGVDSGIPTDSNQSPITTQASSLDLEEQSRRGEIKRRNTAVIRGGHNKIFSTVLDLEKAKDAQAKEIVDLKKRVQKGGQIMKECLIQMIFHGDEVNVDMPVGEKQEQSTKEREVDTSVEDSDAPTTIKEITLAQTLIQIKATKPKVVTTAATTTTTTSFAMLRAEEKRRKPPTKAQKRNLILPT
ncbi:hypothetical protein Tco_0103129 [Tanacetum coccineum]